MMKSLYQLIVLAVLLASCAWARNCHNLTVPVSITAENTNFKFKTPETNIEVTDFVLNLIQQGHNFPAAISQGVRTVTPPFLRLVNASTGRPHPYFVLHADPSIEDECVWKVHLSCHILRT